MKLSSKNIISVAILLASSIVSHARPTIGLKGVDKVVHNEQEKVNNKAREEFVGLQDQDYTVDITPYAPLFDLVCQSDLTDWCNLYPEQCSYVKTLCVKNENDSYCAFDIYQKYLKASNVNMNSINSYIDLCDSCLIEMANEFQLVSQDEEAKNEMKTLGEMCRVKLFMDSYIKDGNKGDEEVISTLASLIPTMDKAKIKRHYGKIYSLKTPEAGFVKSNGKIKYGKVGINEKVNTSIHKNRSTNAKKRQEIEIEEDNELIIFNNIKEKITAALNDIKELALQQVSSIFTELETSVSDMLEDELFISDPDATREKNVITDNILNNIKDILNSNIGDIEIEIEGYIGEQEQTIIFSPDYTTTEDAVETSTVVNISNEEKVVEEEEEEEIPTGEVFQEEVVGYPVSKKLNADDIFEIVEEIKEELGEVESENVANISAAPTESSEDVIVQEVYPEVPTDGYPIIESGTEGDDEYPIENSNDEVNSDDDDIPEEWVDEGPHHGFIPIIKPEIPVVTPGKPHRPWKHGWKIHDHHKNAGHRRPSIIQAINKLFEENRVHYTPSSPEEVANLYKPYKKWMMKKSDYVVSNELLNENIDSVQVESHELPAQLENEFDEGQSIKLNNLDNHRDNNEEESVEIGSKKVSFVNSVHPTKPSLNFRNSEEKRKEVEF